MLDAVTTDSSPCALPPGERADGVSCSSRATLAFLLEFDKAHDEAGKPPRGGARSRPNAADAPPSEVVNRVAKKVGCTTERCVVSSPRIIDFIEKEGGTGAAIRVHAETSARFKLAGPRNDTSLLCNFKIDGVLQRWAGEPGLGGFFNCPFAMMDFEREAYLLGRVHMPDVILGQVTQKVVPAGTARASQVRRPCDTFACVLNTDVSAGGGKHWVCVFVDMRGEPTAHAPWTVEYFNSAGNPPTRAATRWMAKTTDSLIDHLGRRHSESSAAAASKLVRSVAVTSVTHQKSKTECGPYTLFYIRSRLDGNPPSRFTHQRVLDRDMTEFRRHIFSE
jgi:hypothetical protein